MKLILRRQFDNELAVFLLFLPIFVWVVKWVIWETVIKKAHEEIATADFKTSSCLQFNWIKLQKRGNCFVLTSEKWLSVDWSTCYAAGDLGYA